MRKIQKARVFVALPAIVLCTCELAFAATGHFWTLGHSWLSVGTHLWWSHLKWSDSILLTVLGACLMLSTIAVPRLFHRRRRQTAVPPDFIETLEREDETVSLGAQSMPSAGFANLAARHNAYDGTMSVQ